MNESISTIRSEPADLAGDGSGASRPAWEVVSLDCEITAYAPDDDRPLL